MSKQSDAKAAQGYQDKPVPKTCGTCRHFQFAMVLPKWMADQNVKVPGSFGIHNVREGEKRCGLGNFAVKKSATCDQFRVAVAPK